jgi:VIT1/CCC1 family predicted Fe2+/Mn2+ transporter
MAKGRWHAEKHRVHRAGWLRAAVLGANDGIVSVGSLIVGVASAANGSVVVAGIAAWVAGALSMAAGEYVSVSSQADAERADLVRERDELRDFPDAERQELARIYVGRGLDAATADTVARQLMAHDALAAHARDELGISATLMARPLQAAWASAASFSAGALVPLLVAGGAPPAIRIPLVTGTSLLLLAATGYVAARAGGAKPARPVARVVFWGMIAFATTALIGSLVGAVG